METENTKKKRPQVNALYCTEEIANAVNSHQYFAGCITGADKAAKMLEALEFAALWKGRESELQNSDAAIGQLQQEVNDLQRAYDGKVAECENLQGKFNELTAQIADGDTDMQNLLIEKSQVEQERDELQQRIDALVTAGNKSGWEVVRAQIDPAYAAVLEELTNRLIKKFNLSELEPQTVLIGFFMQYYYNQEWEFSGMPFIIKPSEILSIVQKVYPEMTAKVLSQALKVKK